jgi:hypothetical protein
MNGRELPPFIGIASACLLANVIMRCPRIRSRKPEPTTVLAIPTNIYTEQKDIRWNTVDGLHEAKKLHRNLKVSAWKCSLGFAVSWPV